MDVTATVTDAYGCEALAGDSITDRGKEPSIAPATINVVQLPMLF
jgi:hypothetical protein